MHLATAGYAVQSVVRWSKLCTHDFPRSKSPDGSNWTRCQNQFA